jgi:hypothetical protein
MSRFDAGWYAQALKEIDDIYVQELFRSPLTKQADLGGAGGYLRNMREDGWTADRVRADIKTSQEWKDKHPTTPPPPPPSAGIQPIAGVLHIRDNMYQDDRGPILPVFCHAGDFFTRYTRDPDAVRRLLDDIVGKFHGVRFWTLLKGDYWAGREANAGEQTEAFHRFGKELQDRGLKAMISQGDLWNDRTHEDRMRMHRAIRESFPRDVISFVDAGNEVINNGGASAEDCAEWIEGLPGILHLSTTQSELREDLTRWSQSPAQIFDEHGYRDGHWYDKTRHIYNVTYENRPHNRWLGMQSEPFGPGDRVSVSENKHELTEPVEAFAGVVSVMSRQVWCWFSGPGVISDESEQMQDMPGFKTTGALIEQLPRDLMRYERLVHGGKRQGDARVFGVDDPRKLTRCDHAIANDGHFVCCIYGPSPRYERLQAYDSHGDIQLGDDRRIVWGRIT